MSACEAISFCGLSFLDSMAMECRLPHAPLTERKRKAPGMVREIHGVLVANKRVHLYGPRFADLGVHRNIRTLLADMAPVHVASSSDEETIGVDTKTATDTAPRSLAQETVDVLEPLETDLQRRLACDGQMASSIIHMWQALRVAQTMLVPARACLRRAAQSNAEGVEDFTFDSSDVARVHDKVLNLFSTLHRL